MTLNDMIDMLKLNISTNTYIMPISEQKELLAQLQVLQSNAVTSAMVQAGLEAWFGDGGNDDERAMTAAYLAMRDARGD